MILSAAGACSLATADEVGFWSEFSNWQSAMNAAGAPINGFRTSDVLQGQPVGTPVSPEAFADWGVHMQSTSPLEVFHQSATIWNVWGGPNGPSMDWDLTLDTAVYSMYIRADGSCPISLYLGEQLVSQPLGNNPVFNFTHFGVQLDTPFDRIRIQYQGAPHVTIFGGLHVAMPVPGPGAAALAMILTPLVLGARRKGSLAAR